jgi:hypothetical protein
LYREQRKRSFRFASRPVLRAVAAYTATAWGWLSCPYIRFRFSCRGGCPGKGCPRVFAVRDFAAFSRAKAVLELCEILRLFRIEFGRDGRGLGARRITGSVSADAPARTATPPMSAMSVMFFIYIWLYFSVLTRLQFQTKRRSHMGPKSNSSSHWRREARRGERQHDDSPLPKPRFPEKKPASRGTRGRFPR